MIVCSKLISLSWLLQRQGPSLQPLVVSCWIQRWQYNSIKWIQSAISVRLNVLKLASTCNLFVIIRWLYSIIYIRFTSINLQICCHVYKQKSKPFRFRVQLKTHWFETNSSKNSDGVVTGQGFNYISSWKPVESCYREACCRWVVLIGTDWLVLIAVCWHSAFLIGRHCKYSPICVRVIAVSPSGPQVASQQATCAVTLWFKVVTHWLRVLYGQLLMERLVIKLVFTLMSLKPALYDNVNHCEMIIRSL